MRFHPIRSPRTACDFCGRTQAEGGSLWQSNRGSFPAAICIRCARDIVAAEDVIRNAAPSPSGEAGVGGTPAPPTHGQTASGAPARPQALLAHASIAAPKPASSASASSSAMPEAGLDPSWQAA